MNFYTVIIFSVLGFAGTYAVKLPNYFVQCALTDPNLGDCIKNSGNKALPIFIEGDKKIHIVKLNPLHVDSMFIDVNGGLQINLTNFEILGLDTAKLTYNKWDHENRHTESEVHIDFTSLIGQYDVNGRILVLPINGHGPCNITFVQPKFKYFFDFELETRKNKEYVKITNSGLSYETERAYFKLFNLFNGNPQLGSTMAAFLDENWRAVNQEIGTRVGDALALVFSNILQNMFNRIPYSDLFSP